MPDIVSERPLDQLHWLLRGKQTSSEWEDLGEAFNPQFHFLALLPSPSLPPSEVSRLEAYFAAMIETLIPVRELITAYSLKGVMSRTPVSDFSLEVQFSDPDIVDTLRKSLPKELSGCVVTNQRRYENLPTTSAEASMFFRDKVRQKDRDQVTSEESPLKKIERMPDTPIQYEASVARDAIAVMAQTPALAQAAQIPTVQSSTPLRESGRKKMLVPEGITLRGGDILGCAHMTIEGEAYLSIDHCAKLEVSETGIFQGSASVLEAEISGYCNGTLSVKGMLRVTSTGRVVGSIQYGSLQVENGGRIEGEMKIPIKADEAEQPMQSQNARWVDLNAKLSA